MMKVIYFNLNTSALGIEVDMLPKGDIRHMIAEASQKFFPALFFEKSNIEALDQLSEQKMYELISAYRENKIAWLQKHLYVECLEKRYYVNIETNELLTSHAQGLEGSLYVSRDEDFIRLHYHNNRSIEEDLVEISEPWMYRYNPNSPRYTEPNIDEYLPKMQRRK